MTPQERELLPCPFCGSHSIGETYMQTYSVDSSYTIFGCQNCGAGFIDGTEEDWNTRAAAAIGKQMKGNAE